MNRAGRIHGIVGGVSGYVRGVTSGAAEHIEGAVGAIAYQIRQSNLTKIFLRVHPMEPQTLNWLNPYDEIVYHVETNAKEWDVEDSNP